MLVFQYLHIGLLVCRPEDLGCQRINKYLISLLFLLFTYLKVSLVFMGGLPAIILGRRLIMIANYLVAIYYQSSNITYIAF